MSTLTNRLRNAWKAFVKNDCRIDNIVFGVDVRKCSECEKTKEIHVAYICDREQCDNCSYPECRHTTDINHAVNFVRVFDDMWEEKEI